MAKKHQVAGYRVIIKEYGSKRMLYYKLAEHNVKPNNGSKTNATCTDQFQVFSEKRVLTSRQPRVICKMSCLCKKAVQVVISFIIYPDESQGYTGFTYIVTLLRKFCLVWAITQKLYYRFHSNKCIWVRREIQL